MEGVWFEDHATVEGKDMYGVVKTGTRSGDRHLILVLEVTGIRTYNMSAIPRRKIYNFDFKRIRTNEERFYVLVDDDYYPQLDMNICSLFSVGEDVEDVRDFIGDLARRLGIVFCLKEQVPKEKLKEIPSLLKTFVNNPTKIDLEAVLRKQE